MSPHTHTHTRTHTHNHTHTHRQYNSVYDELETDPNMTLSKLATYVNDVSKAVFQVIHERSHMGQASYPITHHYVCLLILLLLLLIKLFNNIRKQYIHTNNEQCNYMSYI